MKNELHESVILKNEKNISYYKSFRILHNIK